MRVHIDQIMHLHKIDSLRAQKRHRTFHRFDPVLFAARPNLRGKKKLVPNSKRRREIADHLLGATIHRRRIDCASTEFYEKREDGFELPAIIWHKIDIEEA